MDFPHGGDELHETIFQAWRCVVGSDAVSYLSGPITTGRKYVDAVAAGLPWDRVLAENLNNLATAAADLRRSTGKVVIDPSPLKVTHWSQEQYMLLWKGLIERHAFEVRFMPDWEYSLGCTMEFVHASLLKIPALSLNGNPISLSEGCDRIGAAIKALEAVTTSHVRLDHLRASLSVQLEMIAR